MGPISACLSEVDWEHKETYMDRTQKGPLHTTLSILMPEKLLSFLSQGKALLAAQLVTARATDRFWQGFVQSESATHFITCCHSSYYACFLFSLTLCNISKDVAVSYVKVVHLNK